MGWMVNVLSISTLENLQLKALGYNNCQAWQRWKGLQARIEGQMGRGVLSQSAYVSVGVLAHYPFYQRQSL